MPQGNETASPPCAHVDDGAGAEPLFYNVRFAAAADYPLAHSGRAEWRPGATPVRVPLPDIPANHVVAASFASTTTAAPFSFRLEAKGRQRFETARFGHRARRRERRRGEAVAVPVDYFDTRTNLAQPVLSLVCRSVEPDDYLLSIAIRPRLLKPPTGIPSKQPIVAATCLSQTTLPATLSAHACSPTATAMALGIAGAEDFHDFVSSARHRPTGMCGVWPQNLWAAARRGRLAALELAADWRLAERVLGAGAPLVASIRFAPNALDGSPMEQTGGHLVLLRGIEDGVVVVNDPAAPPDSVERRYDARQFAAAWMRHRGAAYVFAASSG